VRKKSVNSKKELSRLCSFTHILSAYRTKS